MGRPLLHVACTCLYIFGFGIIVLRFDGWLCHPPYANSWLLAPPWQVFMGYKMNMSYYTDSAMLQTMMEIPLEKKAGRLYAPPGKLQMIYFIDDLNMPALDKYNTQSAIELIKQKQDGEAMGPAAIKSYQ